MKRIKLLLLVGLVGCSQAVPGDVDGVHGSIHTLGEPEKIMGVWDMPSYGIYRVENDEAVCYVFAGYQKGGLSCKFK